jgi:hypothetical protein
MPGSMSARSATRSHDSLPPLSRFALPGGGGGERGRREALTAREASARTSDRPLGLTSGSRQEALEAIMQLREGTRRAKVNERQEWRERSKLFQDLWVQRLENTGPGPSQTPRMRGGDRRVAANRAGPWYTAVSLTQGERLKQKRELNWVAGRVSAAQERRAQSKAKGVGGCSLSLRRERSRMARTRRVTDRSGRAAAGARTGGPSSWVPRTPPRW